MVQCKGKGVGKVGGGVVASALEEVIARDVSAAGLMQLSASPAQRPPWSARPGTAGRRPRCRRTSRTPARPGNQRSRCRSRTLSQMSSLPSGTHCWAARRRCRQISRRGSGGSLVCHQESPHCWECLERSCTQRPTPRARMSPAPPPLATGQPLGAGHARVHCGVIHVIHSADLKARGAGGRGTCITQGAGGRGTCIARV